MTTFLGLGAVLMFLAVALGAFGAHALKKRIAEELLAVYQTGVLYHMIHALGLLIIGITGTLTVADTDWLTVAGWLLFAGILLFSGSLYVLTLSGVRRLGAITPLGGVAFLAGWLCFLLAVVNG
jgi:uncharacterized membrane protein YgdD (TMEM256/DUF423 family)